MDESTPAKVCNLCSQPRPLAEFYKLKKSRDGRHAACRDCFLERRRRRQSMSPEDKVAEVEALRVRATKVCSGCKVEKPRGDFRETQRSRDGIVATCRSCDAEWHRRHYEANREKILAAHREWYRLNREQRAKSRRAYYEANRERFAENQRRWAAANPGARARLVREWRAENVERDRANAQAWREANRERLRELGRRAYAANPEKFILGAHERRARIARVTVGSVDLEALWTGYCGICDELLDRDLAHPHSMSKSLDHIFPLSRGGTHEQGNLQWAHLRCNVAKGARLPDYMREVI